MATLRGWHAMSEYYERTPIACRAWFIDRKGVCVDNPPFKKVGAAYEFNTEVIEPWLDKHRPKWRDYGIGKATPLPDTPKPKSKNAQMQERLDIAKVEKAEAAADRAEIERDQRGGEYATVDEATLAYTDLVSFIKSEVTAFCKTMVKDYPEAEPDVYHEHKGKRAALFERLESLDINTLAKPKKDMPPR